MQPWNVRSKVNCPFCGKEMELMSGTWFYEHDLGLVSLDCEDCHLEIKEYSRHHGYESGEAGSYWILVHALLKRVGGKTND